MSGGAPAQKTSTQVSRSTESGTTGTRRGEKRRVPTSMFQSRTATPTASVFGGTKQTLG